MIRSVPWYFLRVPGARPLVFNSAMNSFSNSVSGRASASRMVFAGRSPSASFSKSFASSRSFISAMRRSVVSSAKTRDFVQLSSFSLPE